MRTSQQQILHLIILLQPLLIENWKEGSAINASANSESARADLAVPTDFFQKVQQNREQNIFASGAIAASLATYLLRLPSRPSRESSPLDCADSSLLTLVSSSTAQPGLFDG